jgi:hypothetical protein
VTVATDLRVGFVVAGVAKAGTTALHRVLDAHPEIATASIKEVHFFDCDLAFPAWGPQIDLYHSYFTNVGDASIAGEVTPGYLFYPRALLRIADYNPEMRVVVILRDPVARAHSHYLMNRRTGREELSFEDALAAESARLDIDPGSDGLFSPYRMYSYMARGMYAQQLEVLFALFPSEQVLLLKNDDLLTRPADTHARLFGFLGVTDIQVSPTSSVVTPHPELPTGTESALRRAFRDDTTALGRLLGWDVSGWL